MNSLSTRVLPTLALMTAMAAAFTLSLVTPAAAQSKQEVYTATLIASEGTTGSSSGRVRIDISSRTTDAETADLRKAFQSNAKSGYELLRTMSKGFITLEGQPGRKIEAVMSRSWQRGRELFIVTEHINSKLEKWRGGNAADYPVSVIRLRFGGDGAPVNGEVFEAVKLQVSADGFLDVQTGGSNKIILTGLAQQ